MSDLLSVSLQDLVYSRQSKLRTEKINRIVSSESVSLLIIRYKTNVFADNSDITERQGIDSPI